MISRRSLRKIFGFVSIPFLVILYLNIEKLAELHGWDGLLAWAWEGYMPTLYEQLTQPWVSYFALAFVAFTAGLWIDVLLRRREVATGKASPDKTDLDAFASKVDALSDKLSELYADGQAEREAFNQQWMNDQTHPSDNRRRVRGDGYAEIELKYSRKFHQKYLREFWSVIGAAQKFTAIELGEVWRLQHGITSLQQIHEAIILLGKISADIRHYGRPDIPFKDTLLRVNPGEQIQHPEESVCPFCGKPEDAPKAQDDTPLACVYCEAQLDQSHMDFEHVNPKIKRVSPRRKDINPN